MQGTDRKVLIYMHAFAVHVVDIMRMNNREGLCDLGKPAALLFCLLIYMDILWLCQEDSDSRI